MIVGNVNNTAKAVRINANGKLDGSFGTGGVVTLGKAAQDDALLDYASSVALLPGGEIAVGGASTPATGQDRPAVEVLHLDGSIETGFGTNGLAVAPPPAGSQAYAPITPVLSSSNLFSSPGYVGLVASPDGRTTLATNVYLSGGATLAEVALARFTALGAPDPTFGTGGQAVIVPEATFGSASADAVTAIALQRDGKLVVGGSVLIGNTLHALATRVAKDGTLDPGFAIGGVNILGYTTPIGSSPGAIAIQGDGKIVLADAFSFDLERLNPNGLPDHSFGVHGTALMVAPDPSQVNSGHFVGVAIQPDGKILATGDNAITRLLGRGSKGDYNNDGVADRSIFLTSSATFADAASSGPAAPLVQIGIPGAGKTLPAPGAYFGGGQDDIGVYLTSRGAFAVTQPTGRATAYVPFGSPGAGNSLPAPGDFDGSGRTEYAVYLPKLGVFAYRSASGGGDVYVAIGQAGPGGSIPAPADYLDTAQDDVAVYVPSNATFVLQNPFTHQLITIPFGTPGRAAIPAPGDYDGSGHAELALYFPDAATLVYRPALGGPDVAISFGIPGAGKTLPAPGDYDGSGHAEVAAYLPTLGIFAYRPARGGADVYLTIGVPGRTIPFALNAVQGATGGSGSSGFAAASVDPASIPWTPDLLDPIAPKRKPRA